MNIVLGVLWQVVIDDVGDVVHMDTSTRDIGSDKDLELTRFETFERLHSFFLGNFSRQKSGCIALPIQAVF